MGITMARAAKSSGKPKRDGFTRLHHDVFRRHLQTIANGPKNQARVEGAAISDKQRHPPQNAVEIRFEVDETEPAGSRRQGRGRQS